MMQSWQVPVSSSRELAENIGLAARDTLRLEMGYCLSNGDDVMQEEVTHTLKIKFKRAIIRIQNLSSRPSNKYLLDLYALFKQANEGDCIGRGNGSLRQRAKFKAWNSLI